MKKILLSVLAIAGFLLFLGSCKKTIGLDPLPLNKILEYKVANMADTVLYGIIDDSDNTITVYVPFYYGLSLIDPEIKLSEGASLTEPILPVNINDDTQTYTVKGADGSTNTYKLKIAQQNPPTFDIAWATKPPVSYPINVVPLIRGNFMTTNAALVKITVTNIKTGTATKLDMSGAGMYIDRSADDYVYQGGFIPATIDTGSYKVKVDFLQKSVELPEPLHIVYRQPGVVIVSRTAKQGEDIEWQAAYQTMLLGLKSVKADIFDGKIYDLPIKSYTYDKMTLTVPEDFPVGSYFASFSFEFENWKTVTAYGSLTVTPK